MSAKVNFRHSMVSTTQVNGEQLSKLLLVHAFVQLCSEEKEAEKGFLHLNKDKIQVGNGSFHFYNAEQS